MWHAVFNVFSPISQVIIITICSWTISNIICRITRCTVLCCEFELFFDHWRVCSAEHCIDIGLHECVSVSQEMQWWSDQHDIGTGIYAILSTASQSHHNHCQRCPCGFHVCLRYPADSWFVFAATDITWADSLMAGYLIVRGSSMTSMSSFAHLQSITATTGVSNMTQSVIITSLCWFDFFELIADWCAVRQQSASGSWKCDRNPIYGQQRNDDSQQFIGLLWSLAWMDSTHRFYTWIQHHTGLPHRIDMNCFPDSHDRCSAVDFHVHSLRWEVFAFHLARHAGPCAKHSRFQTNSVCSYIRPRNARSLLAIFTSLVFLRPFRDIRCVRVFKGSWVFVGHCTSSTTCTFRQCRFWQSSHRFKVTFTTTTTLVWWMLDYRHSRRLGVMWLLSDAIDCVRYGTLWHRMPRWTILDAPTCKWTISWASMRRHRSCHLQRYLLSWSV